MEFSVAEINFICIVKGDNREDTINNIFDVLPGTTKMVSLSVWEKLHLTVSEVFL